MTVMRATLIGFVLVFIGFPIGGDLLGYDAWTSFLVGSVLFIACAWSVGKLYTVTTSECLRRRNLL